MNIRPLNRAVRVLLATAISIAVPVGIGMMGVAPAAASSDDPTSDWCSDWTNEDGTSGSSCLFTGATCDDWPADHQVCSPGDPSPFEPVAIKVRLVGTIRLP